MAIFIPLISVFDNKGITQAKSGLASITGIVKNLKGAALAAAASMAVVGAGQFIQESVSAARDLERNMVGLKGVFGELTPSMTQFSKDAQAIGLSQIEASKASTFLGSVLKQSGFSMEFTAEQTKNLVGLASDLAATYGYDVSEALTGMTALFRGEYDPIEKFGVAMKQAEVNALLAARGQKNLTGASLRQAQAQARLDLLYSRSQDAQGAYARQSDSLFVAQKNLTASMENMKASIGASMTRPLAKLLQSMQPIVEILGKVLETQFNSLANGMTSLGPVLTEVAKLFLTVYQAVAPFSNVIVQLLAQALVPVTRILKFLGNIMTGLTPLFKALSLAFYALEPIIISVSFVIDKVVWALEQLFGWIGSFPLIGAILKSFGPNVDKLTGQMQGLTTVTDTAAAANKRLTEALSKRLPKVDIDTGTTGAKDTATTLENAASSIASSVKDIVDAFKNLGKTEKIMGDFEKEVTDIFTQVDATLGTALKNGFLGKKGVESLKSFAGKEKKILVGIAKQRDLLAKQIAKATEVQSALIDSASITNALDNTSNSIVESIIYLNDKFKIVTSAVSNTSTNLVASFRSNLDKIKNFYANLTALSQGNLDQGLIDQIASAGVDTGNATAEAIIASGQAGIDSLNEIYDQIKIEAGNAGATVGSSMTAAGKDIGNGLIDGLKATETQLADLASQLATTFAEKFKAKMQSGLDAVQAAITEQEKFILAPSGTSVWGNIPTDLGKGKKKFVYKGNEANMPGNMQGIIPRLGFAASNVPVTLPVSKFRNPYKQDNPYYAQFEANALQAAQYNISIKVDPTANAAQVGDAIVKAIQAYEKAKGKKWRNN